jgi:hypothetical protein
MLFGHFWPAGVLDEIAASAWAAADVVGYLILVQIATAATFL